MGHASQGKVLSGEKDYEMGMMRTRPSKTLLARDQALRAQHILPAFAATNLLCLYHGAMVHLKACDT